MATLLALVHGGGFQHALAHRVALRSAGSSMLLGAVGHSTAARTLETGGRMPGLPATLQSQPGDTTISTSAVFFLTGALLLVLGARPGLSGRVWARAVDVCHEFA